MPLKSISEFVVDQSPVGMVFVITVYVDNESLCGRLMNKCLEFFFEYPVVAGQLVQRSVVQPM